MSCEKYARLEAEVVAISKRAAEKAERVLELERVLASRVEIGRRVPVQPVIDSRDEWERGPGR